MNNKVLFLGLTNYCASRFAEIMFNHFASEHLLNVYSISRGVNVKNYNEPVDPRTLNALTARGVLMSTQLRNPVTLKAEDFDQCQYIVLISGKDLAHRIARAKGIEEKKIIVWEFNQIEESPTHELFPALEAEVYLLVRRLQQQQYQYAHRITA